MSDMPELRPGPPWAMEEMILSEPGLVAPILNTPETLLAAGMLRETDTVVVTGCGTTEHAAMAGAALFRARAPRRLRGDPGPAGGRRLIAITHEAGTAATLTAMRATSARTILITAKPEDGDPADLDDRHAPRRYGWCHTVGYVSPLLAFTAIAGAADETTCSRVIDDTLELRAALHEAAQTLARASSG